MSNLRIGYLNHADSATLTATPTAVSGAVSYLANDSRGDVMLGTVTSQVIKGTWNGTSKTISQLTLWRTNLAYGDLVRLQLHENADWTGTTVYDSTSLAAYASGLFDDWGWSFVNRYFTPYSCKSFTLGIAAAAAPQLARIYLGPYTEAPIQIGEGATLTPETNSTQKRSEGGSLRTIVKADWRSLAFDMMVETEAYRAAWHEINRYTSISKAFVASVYPGDGGTVERDLTIYGKWQTPPGSRLAQNKYDFSMKILEL